MANPSTILIRREVLDRIGGFEESFIGAVQTFEDDAFLAKLQLRESVFVATECWSRYRRHENSLLSIMTNTGKTGAARLFYLTWLEQYLGQQRVEADEIRGALREAFWPYRHPVRHAIRSATTTETPMRPNPSPRFIALSSVDAPSSTRRKPTVLSPTRNYLRAQ